eukprot:1008114-Rhodomonas_salina.2
MGILHFYQQPPWKTRGINGIDLIFNFLGASAEAQRGQALCSLLLPPPNAPENVSVASISGSVASISGSVASISGSVASISGSVVAANGSVAPKSCSITSKGPVSPP